MRRGPCEEIRKVLRETGCREFGGADGGFAVEGGESGAPFLVACGVDGRAEVEQEMRRCRQALAGAGMRVESAPRTARPCWCGCRVRRCSRAPALEVVR
ncbi:hypothetical protein GCM10010381_63550 [Streptomyces xantholiticus]|nr:hypothetical protein GCM10010381_63550 [Streptomyces xantholiticus]